MKVNLSIEHIQSQVSTEVNLRCNNKNYKILAAAIIPLMSISTAVQIPLKYQEFVQILGKEEKAANQQQQKIQGEFPIAKATELINFAKKYFNRVLKIDLTVLAMRHFLSEENKQSQIQSADLDKLPLNSLIKLYKHGIDLLPAKMKHRVARFLKKYINETKRSQSQKILLNKLHVSLKNLKKQKSDEEDWGDVQENQPQFKINVSKPNNKSSQEGLAFRNQKKQQKSKQKLPGVEQVAQTQKKEQKNELDSYPSNSKMSKKILKGNPNQEKADQPNSDDQINPSTSKQERKPRQKRGGPRNKQNKRGSSFNKEFFGDFRITLGIRGDTLAGWRQRYRPKKYPQSQLVQIKRQKTSNTQAKRQSKQEISSPKKDDQGAIVVKKQYKKIEQVKKQQKSLSVVYKFPADKKNVFKFDSSKSYRIKVNDKFWINVDPEKQITNILLINSNKGFLRKGRIQIIDGGKGFMTEGLTFSFESICNMQDGGIAFGDATVLDFIPSGKQWFTLESVEVLSYE